MFEFGQFNEFSDSVAAADPVILAVAKGISLGPWTGKFYEAMGAPATTLDSKTFKVYGRSKTSRNGVIGADASDSSSSSSSSATGGWDNDDVTGLPMPAAACRALTVGHVLQVGDEVVTVKAVDRDNNTISVFVRGDAGTTAAAHVAGTAYKVIGFAGNDTDLKNVEGVTETTNEWENYVQTVFEVIDWTKHGELVNKGLSEAQARVLLIKEAETRVAELLGTMAVLGRKNKAISNAKRFMSAGLLQQLTDTNGGKRAPLTYAVGGTLTEAKVIAALKQVFDAGGNPDTIWCGPTVKGYVNNFNMANSSLAIQAAKNDHTAGGQYVTHIDYEGKVLAVRVDAEIPASNLAIVTQAQCKKGWLVNDGLRLVDEPAASSREFRKSLQGSVGFVIEGVGQDHILLTGITGGPSERIYKTASSN